VHYIATESEFIINPTKGDTMGEDKLVPGCVVMFVCLPSSETFIGICNQVNSIALYVH